MQQTLFNHYIKITVPGIVGVLMLYFFYKSGVDILYPVSSRWLTAILLVITGLFSIVIPIWYRIIFMRRNKHRKALSTGEFIRFEKRFLSIASVSVYFLIIAFLVKTQGLPFAIMFIFVFYAIYFYYPSEKRIKSEKQIFKVSEKQENENS